MRVTDEIAVTMAKLFRVRENSDGEDEDCKAG